MRGLILFTVFIASAPAFGVLADLATEASFEEQMIPFFGQGFPTTPMAEGVSELKIVPASFTSSKDLGSGKEFDVSGAGLALSYVRAHSPHWGFGLMVGLQAANGENTSLFESNPTSPVETNSSSFTQTPKVKENSSVVMANVIYDPFSDPQGFRLPLFLGVAYYNENATTRANGNTVLGNGFAAKVERSVSGILPMAGAALQFNTGSFRWTTFGILSLSYDAEITTTATNTSTSAQSEKTFDPGSSHTIGGVGLEVQYRPLNISMLFIPEFSSEISFLSLKWTKKWGANAAASVDATSESIN